MTTITFNKETPEAIKTISPYACILEIQDKAIIETPEQSLTLSYGDMLHKNNQGEIYAILKIAEAPKLNYANIVNKIKSLTKTKTDGELAKLLNLSYSDIYKLRNGAHIGPVFFIKIMEYLNLTPDQLYTKIGLPLNYFLNRPGRKTKNKKLNSIINLNSLV